MIQRLHRHKCKYLCLDPDVTPLFPQFPEYFYNPEFREWYPLPDFNEEGAQNLPKFHPNNYPRMANMPVEAFRETDEPIPDPAQIYPPGLVAISYFFGPPMSLDPAYSEISEKKRQEMDEMPITYVDPDSGRELPIPEIDPNEFEALWQERNRVFYRSPSPPTPPEERQAPPPRPPR